MHSKIDQIKLLLKEVPNSPGVYLWKDENGEVLYVGKAKALRARMRSYVNFSDDRAKIPLLVEKIDSFDYIVVENENESLILEKNLIEQYKPFFNADLKDDSSYPFIAITTDCKIPAIKFTREKKRAGVKYFGPYTDSRAARRIIDLLRKIIPLCSTKCNTWKKMQRSFERANKSKSRIDYEVVLNSESQCFDSTVGLASGICCGMCDLKKYASYVKAAENFLNGDRVEILDQLKEEMKSASLDLNFERAKRIKDKIDIIEALSQNQHISIKSDVDMDVIGFWREETIAGVHVLILRGSKIVNSNEFILNKGLDVPNATLQHNFLLKYYELSENPPRQIVLRENLEEDNTLTQWISQKLDSKHGAKVRFVEAKRGEKFELLRMAERNAKHTLLRYKVKSGYDDDRTNDALLQIESALALKKAPLRIECFDISTNHGSYTVASMVVFENGKANKSQYRRFKIKTHLDEANDFLSMQEVMKRRYAKERLSDESFGRKPDLVILDGGLPQLNAARTIFNQFGIDDIELCGLAKRDEEIFTTWNGNEPVVLPSGSSSLYLVKSIRDEAHRFAITYHRHLYKIGQTKSILDEVTGLGPKRKRALLKHFGGFKKLQDATLQEIVDSKVVPNEVAKETYLVLQQYRQKLQDVIIK